MYLCKNVYTYFIISLQHTQNVIKLLHNSILSDYTVLSIVIHTHFHTLKKKNTRISWFHYTEKKEKKQQINEEQKSFEQENLHSVELSATAALSAVLFVVDEGRRVEYRIPF